MSRLIVTLFLLFSLALGSCREEVLTEGEQTARQVSEVVKREGIELCFVYAGGNLMASGSTFSIDGSMLVISTLSGTFQYLPFGQLLRFQLINSQNQKVIVFYFR